VENKLQLSCFPDGRRRDLVNKRFIYSLQSWIAIIPVLFISACSNPNDLILYEGEDFIFSAPAGYETELYETPVVDSITNSEHLLFSNIGHYPYFIIIRQEIPVDSDLESVFAEYVSIMNEWHDIQFISQNTLTIDDRTAIEYVHREFIGEPYVQTREIWMEYNGWAYSLVCGSPVTAAPGAVIPVSEHCIQLAEGFQFK
jgi:hypothetical protein